MAAKLPGRQEKLRFSGGLFHVTFLSHDSIYNMIQKYVISEPAGYISRGFERVLWKKVW